MLMVPCVSIVVCLAHGVIVLMVSCIRTVLRLSAMILWFCWCLVSGRFYVCLEAMALLCWCGVCIRIPKRWRLYARQFNRDLYYVYMTIREELNTDIWHNSRICRYPPAPPRRPHERGSSVDVSRIKQHTVVAPGTVYSWVHVVGFFPSKCTFRVRYLDLSVHVRNVHELALYPSCHD